MGRKLFKYECMAYARSLIPMDLILLGVGLLCRFIQFFESDILVYKICFVSSIVALCISALICLILTEVIAVTRFYKNMFTSEGYLSFTLPVTCEQHIFVKLLSALLFDLISFFTVLLSSFAALDWDTKKETLKAIGFIFRKLGEKATWNMPLYILEAIVALVLLFAAVLLLFYTCIAIGQLAHKNRVLAAVGTYFGFYLAEQIISTILLVVFTVVEMKTELLSKIVDYVYYHTLTSVHIGMGIVILISALLGFMYFMITRYIMKNKLNLE